MASYYFPTQSDFKLFFEVLRDGEYKIKKYLPSIDADWFRIVSDCLEYVEGTAKYEECSFHELVARLLYKVVKRHELGDGNKRTSVIVTYLFCLVNGHAVTSAKDLKAQAKRAARSKGRVQEDALKKKIAETLKEFVIPRE
ncbi:type II toxin-antitoxin system death-on-curing family toxin [Patescibacteria group bacterium]|nr:type II toxin-antitoxin system death-on-curing family toxin [Patescibacteria group bacterium]